jgi:hypothetical protein
VTDWADLIPSTRGLGATIGTATSAGGAGSAITVDVGGQAITATTARDLTAAVGDLLSLHRHGSTWYALAILGTAAVDITLAGDPAPDVRPDSVTGRFVLQPVETATYRAGAGWRDDTTDLYQGQQSGTGLLTGAAFYGAAGAALAGATVTRAELNLKRLAAGPWAAGGGPTVKLVTEATRPGGAPTLTGSLAGPDLNPDTEGTLDIGTTWGQALVDGTAGGLAIDVATSTPYLRLAGVDSWPAGMSVVIDWRRDG